MNPRIAAIENLIAEDPGKRNVFALVVADQIRLAAQSLRQARRVGIVSGFFIPEAGAGETDGPHGAKVIGTALESVSGGAIKVDYITDAPNEKLFNALGIKPIVDAEGYLNEHSPTHLLAIERLGRGADGRYRNMRGLDVTSTTAPLDDLFIEGSRRGLTTIGIGDGGNEIGMGKVFIDQLNATHADLVDENRTLPATTVSTDFCIAAGVSNWGAYGLVGALSVLEGRDLLPSAPQAVQDIDRLVHEGGAVDGVTLRRESTVDGLAMSHSLRILESVRRLIAPSPLERDGPLTVGVLGYGETGRAATALLARNGHQVRLSDLDRVIVERGSVVAGVESGGHSIDFLGACDLVVASPGVRPDAPVIGELHLRGIPVFSELELAYQLSDQKLIAVTGTVGKRTTVELMREIFDTAGQPLDIGGNRGLPLSALLLNRDRGGTGFAQRHIAIAVSSFQLESVVHFRPSIAVVLNVDEAHLDRHQTLAEYVRIKSRIFMNHGADDLLILNFDDPRVIPLARKHRGRTYFVSSRQAVDRGAWLANGVVHVNMDGHVEKLGPASPPFPENLLSCIVAARACSISAEQCRAALRDMQSAGRTQ